MADFLARLAGYVVDVLMGSPITAGIVLAALFVTAVESHILYRKDKPMRPFWRDRSSALYRWFESIKPR